MALQRRHLVLAGPAVASALVEAARAEETAAPEEPPKTLLQRIIARGQASFYGRGLQGRRTASGERFDRKAMTAAHPTLPFGTRVHVENLLAGRSVVVRINDRGPFTRGRIIDLSEAAGGAIGLRGVGPVQITPMLAE